MQKFSNPEQLHTIFAFFWNRWLPFHCHSCSAYWRINRQASGNRCHSAVRTREDSPPPFQSIAPPLSHFIWTIGGFEEREVSLPEPNHERQLRTKGWDAVHRFTRLQSVTA